MDTFLIAVDIGTQGTKAVLFDTELRELRSAFEPSCLIRRAPDAVWQEPEEIYASCVRTIRELMEKSGTSPKKIAAIGVDSQMAGIMGIDKDGEAVTIYDSWLDTRCSRYAEQMKKIAGKRINEITGSPVTCTHGPKILWWKQEENDAYRQIYKFVLPHGYVVGKITGKGGNDAVFDYTELQYSGFGDNLKKEWSRELMELFGVDESKFARICSPFECIGKTTAEFAQASGLCEGIPVAAGAGDTAASALGAGLFRENMVLDCAGTASALCCVVNRFVPDIQNETMTMMRSPIDGLWTPLAYINGGGMCLKWFRDNFAEDLDYKTLDDEAERAELSNGLLFIPHFTGRVLPADNYIRGCFIGLTFLHTRAQLYRAVMEGIAYEYSYYMKVLRGLFPEMNFREVSSIGGGAKSPVFGQIKADVLGMRLSAFQMNDTALIGSAAIAGVAAGIYDDCRQPIIQRNNKTKSFDFDMDRHEKYKKNADRYCRALEKVSEIYKEGEIHE